MPDAEVRLRLDHVLTTVRGATQKALEAVAFQTEGRAKVKVRDNDQIDTSFMLNSIYTVTPTSSGYSGAKGAAEAKTKSGRSGREVGHSGDMAPAQRLPHGVAAAVAVGANYAIFQEIKRSFLYAGAEEAAREAEGTCERVFTREVHD
jgi:hypothetical protein